MPKVVKIKPNTVEQVEGMRKGLTIEATKQVDMP